MLLLTIALAVALVLALLGLGVLIRARRSPTLTALAISSAAVSDQSLVHNAAAGQVPARHDADVWETLLLATPDGAPSRLWLSPWSPELGPAVGRHLSASSPLARGLRDLVQSRRPGSSAQALASTASELYFRFDASPELLRGLQRGLYEVMPSSAGGYRSAVRGTAGKKVVGHGQFVPAISSGGAGAGAVAAGAVGVAAAPALAPVILVAALTAALEMAAEAEQRRQLEGIRKIVAAVRKDQVQRQMASLDAAAHALELSACALIDGGTVPSALGLDSHAAEIATAWHESRRTLATWQEELSSLPERPSPSDLVGAFPGIENSTGGDFWRELALAQTRLQLHGRATLLAAAQAATADPENAYVTFRRALEQYTKELQKGADDLRDFAGELASRRIKLGTMVTGGTANQMLAVTHRLLALAKDLEHPQVHRGLPAAIGPGGVLEIEGVQHADGSLTLLAQPVLEAAKPGSTVSVGVSSGSDSRNAPVVLENRSCRGTKVSIHEGHPVDARVPWLHR